jgi:hypothetical protein
MQCSEREQSTAAAQNRQLNSRGANQWVLTSISLASPFLRYFWCFAIAKRPCIYSEFECGR